VFRFSSGLLETVTAIGISWWERRDSQVQAGLHGLDVTVHVEGNGATIVTVTGRLWFAWTVPLDGLVVTHESPVKLKVASREPAVSWMVCDIALLVPFTW